MAKMAVARDAFKQHREALENAIDPNYLTPLLHRLEEKDLISRKLRIDISSLPCAHSEKQEKLFTALETQILTKRSAYSDFLTCLEKMEVFGPIVEQMQATYGKFTAYTCV